MSDTAGKPPNGFVAFLSGGYYAMAITTSVAGIIIWSVQQAARISELERDVAVQGTRIESIDAHGTRTLPLAEQRTNVLDARVTEGIQALGSRMTEVWHSVGIIQQSLNERMQKLDLLNERLDNILHRLDRLEEGHAARRSDQDIPAPIPPWGGSAH